MKVLKPGAPGVVLLAALLALASPTAFSASVTQQNLVDLVQHADEIVVGTIQDVTDGFTGAGVPYTEITLAVSDVLRGKKVGSYTFRQFGLTEPREIDGRLYLGTSPEGWPHWQKNESVLLFLGPAARLTGLRTTVGLGQGKLQLVNGAFHNAAGNAGLFRDVSIKATGLSPAQQDMLASDGKPAPSAALLDLVRRAVNENWIATGVMNHAK